MNSMTQQVICLLCGQAKTRQAMSCLDSICMDCFNLHYTICACCGAFLRRGPRRFRDRSPRLDGDCYINPRNGGVENSNSVLCQQCYGNWQHENDSQRRNKGIYYWRPKALDVSIATYKRIGSKRKFGVEIETANCGHHTDLYGKTNFGCKGDCSISGLEFDSPILYGDEGLEYIEYFMEFADDHNWTVNEDCGCHTQYDMRDESDESLFRIAYAYARTSNFWACFVPCRRRRNSYSHELSYTWRDIRSAMRLGTPQFSLWCRGHDRYDYINTGAYNQHITFENRLLEGCLNPNDICSWITLHCRFMDHVKKLHFDDLDQLFDKHPSRIFSALNDIFNDKGLADWMADRASRFEYSLRGPQSWEPPELTGYDRY